MPKAKFNAVKMSGAQVSHISLVERGANRIPFKVVKKEKQGMSAFEGLDLGGLFSRRKAEKAEPQVVAVVTMKGEGFDSIKKQVEDAGFAVADMQEMEDGSMVFKQGEFSVEDADTQVIRMNDEVAIVMKGFSPYNMDVFSDGVSFAEQCAAKGFYPGVSTIMETLGDAMRTAVQKADTPAAAKAVVAKMFSEASAYAASFIAALPQKAFKLEMVQAEVAPAMKEEGQEGTTTSTEISSEAETATEVDAAATSTDESVEKACKTTGKTPEEEDAEKMKAKKEESAETTTESAQEALTAEKVSDIVSSQVEALVQKSMAPMMEMLKTFNENFSAVQKSVTDMTGEISTVAGRVAEAESVAKAAKEAVAGVVISGSETGDSSPASAKKSESGVFGGREIDTAYMGNVRKRASR